VTTSIVSDGRLVMHRGRPVSGPAHDSGGSRFRREIGKRLNDVVWLLLIVLLAPVAILVIGTPVALFARLLIEIAERY
jgi:hypothetical protein